MAWAAHGDCDQADHDTGSRGLQTVHGAPCEPNSNRHIAVPWCRQHTRPRHAHPCPARARPRSTRKPGPQRFLEPTARSVRLFAAYDSTSGSASYAGQLGRAHGLLRDPSPLEAVPRCKCVLSLFRFYGCPCVCTILSLSGIGDGGEQAHCRTLDFVFARERRSARRDLSNPRAVHRDSWMPARVQCME